MSLWTRVRQLYTKTKNKNVEGGAQMYIICILLMMFMIVVFKLMIDRERIYITYDSVDDALIESLLAGCTINTEELGMGGHTVIYRTVTPEELGTIPGLGRPVDIEPFDPLDNPDIYSPSGDFYLERSYDAFMRVLKQNLGLEADMTARISGIDGMVTIDEFSIYNVYRSFDDDGNQTGYRVVKYTRLPSGSWSCYPYPVNSPVNVYNSIDHYDFSVLETSVAATISFDCVAGTSFGSYDGTLTADDFKQHVSYSRIVDVVRH